MSTNNNYPSFLYRGFDKKQCADDFFKLGKFSLSSLEFYRGIEDSKRKDDSEGIARRKIVPFLGSVPIDWEAGTLNPVYILCFHGPETPLSVLCRYKYLIRINNPKQLHEDMSNSVPEDAVTLFHNAVQFSKVIYNKDHKATNIVEGLSAKGKMHLISSQKPDKFANECEYRYIVEAESEPLSEDMMNEGLSPDHSSVSRISYNLNKPLSYAELLRCPLLTMFYFTKK